MVAVCVIVGAAHWPALSAQATSIDDPQYLHENHLVQNPSWRSAKQFLSEVIEPSTVGGYYQPLTMISLMLDYAMGGRPDNLTPFHVTSFCLHVINTALVIVLLYMLFGKVWPAVLAGLLFGVHPLTVESIPWVAERKTLLASFFALWCMIIYVRYTHKSNWKLYAVCMLMYVLALMSKPTTTPLPVLLLLFDFWPLRRPAKRAVIEKVPLFAIAAIFAVITVISQGRAAEVAMPGEYSPIQIPLILCHNIVFYLYKIIWPTELSSHYPFPSPLAVSNPMVLAGIIGTCILIPALLVCLRWTRAPLTGWLFFFVAISPTMGVIGFTYVIVSGKYAYLPSVGLLMVLTWALAGLWGRVCVSPARRIIIAIFVLVAGALEFAATRRYLVHWQDTERHLQYMFSLAPDSVELHNFAGCFLAREGKNQEAIAHFLEALRIKPDYHRVHNNLGIALAKEGKVDEAFAHLTKAVQLNPNNENANYNLGLVLVQKGENEKAITYFRKAMQMRPDSPYTMINLAYLLATSKNPELRNGAEALRLAKRACELTNYSNPEMLRILEVARKSAASERP
jgi:hypothetical protein